MSGREILLFLALGLLGGVIYDGIKHGVQTYQQAVAEEPTLDCTDRESYERSYKKMCDALDYNGLWQLVAAMCEYVQSPSDSPYYEEWNKDSEERLARNINKHPLDKGWDGGFHILMREFHGKTAKEIIKTVGVDH